MTYIGSFTLGNPRYRLERAPGTDKQDRQVIVFNLVPLEADLSKTAQAKNSPGGVSRASWAPPSSTSIAVAGREIPEGRISRVEFELQAAFGEWLRSQGETVETLALKVEDGTWIRPDLYSPSLGVVVEAKMSQARSYVRQAIGQVLDYQHQARLKGIEADPVILLPSRPAEGLCALLAELGLTLYYPSAGGSFHRE